jgi:uroporphyrinogen-III decarboxylase
VRHPLEDLRSWSSYEFPDPDEQEHLRRQYREFELGVREYGETHAIVGGVTCTILEGAEMLRGMSALLMDMHENEDFVHELFDRLMHYHLRIGRRLIELGVDIICIGDDAGTQRGMLLSPETWRRYLKPRYDVLFRQWRKARSDIIIAFHSDGDVEPVVGDLVEIGLDVLNPVQPGCMDDRRLKREYGDTLTFWGGINVQKTIPFGAAAEVVAEVRDRIETFGRDGGFIISPAHNVQPNVRSIDNTLAYYWACQRYGRYE